MLQSASGLASETEHFREVTGGSSPTMSSACTFDIAASLVCSGESARTDSCRHHTFGLN